MLCHCCSVADGEGCGAQRHGIQDDGDACLVAEGCGGGSSQSNPSSAASVPFASELQLCVDQANPYRDNVGRPTLTPSGALDSYATAAARNDRTAHAGHHYFNRTSGGGVASAENEVTVVQAFR